MRFTKHDACKSELDLLPPLAIEIVGFVLRAGRIKYESENWRKCPNHKKYIAAMLRHALKHFRGESTDSQTGLLHLAQAVCSGLFALELYAKIGEDGSMERKQFNYFGVIERKSAKRGVVKKRFRSYEKAWDYLSSNGLEPSKALIMTVKTSDKIGMTVKL